MKCRDVTVDIPGRTVFSGTLELAENNVLLLYQEPKLSVRASMAAKRAAKKGAAVVVGTAAGIVTDPKDALITTASIAGMVIKKQLNPNAMSYPSPGARKASAQLWDSIKTNVDTLSNCWITSNDVPLKETLAMLELTAGFHVYMESDQKSLRLLFPQAPRIMRLFFLESDEARKCYRKLSAICRKLN